MGRRRVLAVVALSAVSLCAMLFLRAADRGRGDVEPAPSPAPVSPSAEALGEAAPAFAQPEMREDRTARVPDRASAPDPAPGIEAQEGVRLVELVEAGTLRPVPHAEVGYRTWEGSLNPRVFARVMGDADTRRTRADELGLARFVWPGSESLLVLARADGLAGAASIVAPRSPDEIARVELLRDWAVTVEVVDAFGRPAPRVPVSLTLREPNETAVEHRSTDAEGRVVYEHVGLQLEMQPASVATLALALPLSLPQRRALERDAAPRAPIRFQLPPAGEVALALQDRRGTPAPDGTDVQLALFWPGETQDVSPFADTSVREPIHRSIQDGRVLFEHVELGAALEVSVRSGALETHALAGPSRPGERVERRLVLGLHDPLLLLRALEGDGRPLADAELDCVLVRGGGESGREEFHRRTDPAGRFSLVLGGSLAPDPGRYLLVAERAGEVGARVDLSRPFPAETVDLGAVVLAPAPLLIAGRVLDDAGEPLTGARVQLELMARDGRRRFDGALSPLSDGSGEFTVRHFTDATSVRAWAELAGRRSEAVEAAVGASDVVLSLRSTGALAGSVRLDAGVPADSLRLRLARSREDEARARGRDDRNAALLSDGRFRFEGLLPGRYELAIGPQDDVELALVRDLEVLPGETCADARIQELDLRGRVHAVSLVLRAPAGASLSGVLAYGTASGGASHRSLQVNGSPVRFTTAWERIDGTLSVRGFRRVRLEDVHGEHEVELVPALPVRLVLPSHVSLPEPPVFVKAVLVAAGDDEAGIDFGVPAFDASREVTGFAPESGRMRVCWIGEWRQPGGGATATTLSVAPEQFVEVADLDAEQRFELAITDEALRGALAAADVR